MVGVGCTEGRFWDTKCAGALFGGVLGLILRNFHDENTSDAAVHPPFPLKLKPGSSTGAHPSLAAQGMVTSECA